MNLRKTFVGIAVVIGLTNLVAADAKANHDQSSISTGDSNLL